ncbi:MAG: ATP-binding protein [Bacilli bacterium]
MLPGETTSESKQSEQSTTLAKLLKLGAVSRESFLNIAIGMAHELLKIHDEGGVHGNLTPQCVRIGPERVSVALMQVDEGSAQTGFEPNRLPYIAPEQTGRMQRKIDHRTDIYSFGVILYQMMTGEFPYSAHNRVEWVHAHIALAPHPITAGSEFVEVSHIAVKCMEKLPEDRYQSMYGLVRDLEDWNMSFLENEHIFYPGLSDVPGALRISRRLYARESTVEFLNSLWQETRTGKMSVAVIAGDPGAGKTTLLKNITESLLLSGAFIAYAQVEPLLMRPVYSPLVEAFRVLVQRVLASGDEELENWRVKLRRLPFAFLLGIIPEMGILFSETVEQKPLQSDNMKDNVLVALRSVLQEFAAEHPVLMCLDDLHWADSNTVELLSALVSGEAIPGVMFLLATRSQYPEYSERLFTVRNRIELQPLTAENIVRMLSDTLQTASTKAVQLLRLSQMIHARTVGNPLFVRQFLLDLIARRWLYFDSKRGIWQIQFEEIEQIPVNRNILQLLREQMSILSENTRSSLKWCSCLGPDCTVTRIVKLDGVSRAELLIRIAPAVQWGFVVLEEETDRILFSHDEVRSAFYESISGEQRLEMHDQIAMLVNGAIDSDALSIFRVVYHLSFGRRAEEEREFFAHSAFQAGLLVKEALDHEQAITYFSMGIAALTPDDWAQMHDLQWMLHFELSRCYYAVRWFQQAEDFLALTLDRANTEEQFVKAIRTKMFWLDYQERWQDVADLTLAGLRRLGLVIYGTKSLGLTMSIAQLLMHWRGRSMRSILEGRTLENRSVELQLQLLQAMVPSAYHVDERFFITIGFTMMRLNFQYGMSPEFSHSLNNLAMIWSAALRRFKTARFFGLTAIRVANRSKIPSIQVGAAFTFATFVNPGSGPLQDSLSYLNRAEAYAKRADNLMIHGPIAGFQYLAVWFLGRPLAEVLERIEDYEPIAQRSGDSLLRGLYEMNRPVIEALLGQRPLEYLRGASQYLVAPTARGAGTVLLRALYLFGFFAECKTAIAQIRKLDPKKLFTMYTAEWTTLVGLLAAVDARAARGAKRRRAQRQIRRAERELGGCIRAARREVQHKIWLLQAERLRLSGAAAESLRLYERAGEDAERMGCHPFAGIAYERAALLCMETDRTLLVDVYAERAIAAYGSWGCTAKVEQMQSLIPVQDSKPSETVAETAVALSMDEFTRMIDTDLVLDVTRSLSEEVTLDKLLRKLIRNMVLHTGAERGMVVLERGESLYMEAEGRESEESISLFRGEIPLESFSEVPKSIVYYVRRTLEPVVAPDVRRDARFAGDSSFADRQPISIMCVPILRQMALIGIVYLEHTSIPDLFSQAQLRLVTMIGAQAAVSIENAYLYETLESRIKARTEVLNTFNETLRETNERLSRSEEIRRQMISDISHDLRTPLTSIQGYLEAVVDGVVRPAEVRKYLTIARDRTLQINALIQDLLDLSKFDENYGRLNKDMVSIIDLAYSVYRKHEFDVRRDGFQFSLVLDETLRKMQALDFDQFSPDNEIFVHIDMRRIDQVFNNLISNAVHHTPSGGRIVFHVLLCSDAQGTLVGGDDLPRYALFIIEDTGIGIGEKDLPFIFERFYKTDPSRNRSAVGGSGLGLAICKSIVAAHDGQIWAASDQGKGTRINFTLPVAAGVSAFSDDPEESVRLELGMQERPPVM